MRVWVHGTDGMRDLSASDRRALEAIIADRNRRIGSAGTREPPRGGRWQCVPNRRALMPPSGPGNFTPARAAAG